MIQVVGMVNGRDDMGCEKFFYFADNCDGTIHSNGKLHVRCARTQDEEDESFFLENGCDCDRCWG